MGNAASVPLSSTSLDPDSSSSVDAKPRIKKSSLPSLAHSSFDFETAPPVWRRASEPSVTPSRRKSLLRKNNRRKSEEERIQEESRREQKALPSLVIGGGEGRGDASSRDSRDSYDGLMIRVGGRKFSRAEPVDTGDALEALERLTRAASVSTTVPSKETGLGLMTNQARGTKAPVRMEVPFSFDVNYRLDSPPTKSTFAPSPALQPFPVASQQLDVSPFDSPASRHPLSPISHWSESSACGLTPPQTFQSFRNSVNLSKTINRYSTLFVLANDSTTSSNSSIVELAEKRSTARSKLGGMWRGKKGKRKSKELGKIVVLGGERVGAARYAGLGTKADEEGRTRSSSASSSFPSSPIVGNSSSSCSSRLDRASWLRLEPATTSAHTPSPTARRHSSPDPQLANLVAASPDLAFARPEDNIFLPFDTDIVANPSPVKVSTRIPSGHPAAYHLGRFATQRNSPPPAPSPIRRPRFSERTSSFTSAQRLSAYTTGSRQSVISDVESNSSALHATVQHGFRTSRVGSVSVQVSDLVSTHPVPLPFGTGSRRPSQANAIPTAFQRRTSTVSAGWNDSRRPSQASALSFPRSDSPGCPRTTTGRQLSITSTFFGDSPSSQELTPPPVPPPRHGLDFSGYSLKSTDAVRVEKREGARPRPPSLDLARIEARSSTPNSLPPLTSATSASFSSRSSIDPCPSFQVPVPTRPFGRLSLEQPDLALSLLSTPLPPSPTYAKPIDFGNFSLDPWNRDKRNTASVLPSRHTLSPTTPSEHESRFILSEPKTIPFDTATHAREEEEVTKTTGPIQGLNEYSWNRASAGDALSTSRHPGPSTSSSCFAPRGLEDRRETYPRHVPSRSNQKKQTVFDTLVQQAMMDVPRHVHVRDERKRGLSREEVRIWLGDRQVAV